MCVQIVTELFEAAKNGNSAAVQNIIATHGVAPDTNHHVTEENLVLALCDMKATSESMECGLAAVLRVLYDCGWSLTPRTKSNSNGLHILAGKPLQAHVAHRLRVLLDHEMQHPRLDSMLCQRNASDLLPEDAAVKNDAPTQLTRRDILREARLEVERRIAREGAVVQIQDDG